jgi:alpha-2-macroglobulin-like protein
VASLQQEDGHLRGETTSITGSGDRNLEMETTALAVLAWLKANNPAEFKKPLDKAINWIGKQRGGFGGYGSTQATILALKALIAYTKANKHTAEAGELNLLVDGKPMMSRKFPAGVAETLSLELAEPEKILKPGPNKVRLDVTGKTAFPYTVTWAYNSMQPASDDHCQVRLTTKLARNEAAEGDTVRLNVRVENLVDKGQGMAIAIIGLPGGMSIPEDLKQLKDYTRLPENGKRGMLSAFEIRGRELVLYWRDLAPQEVIELPVDLVCRVPGEYSGPASRAYLYYNDDHKHWVDPLRISIAAAK